MAQRDISRLCQSVLPAGFEQARQLLPRIQAFLQDNLPETVRQSVTVLVANETEIVLAANTPMVANYLRLHSVEIQQQLREGLQLQQALKFRTVPDALLQQRTSKPLSPARKAGGEAVAVIRRNADWIEDENLRAALLDLADSLDSAKD